MLLSQGRPAGILSGEENSCHSAKRSYIFGTRTQGGIPPCLPCLSSLHVALSCIRDFIIISLAVSRDDCLQMSTNTPAVGHFGMDVIPRKWELQQLCWHQSLIQISHLLCRGRDLVLQSTSLPQHFARPVPVWEITVPTSSWRSLWQRWWLVDFNFSAPSQNCLLTRPAHWGSVILAALGKPKHCYANKLSLFPSCKRGVVELTPEHNLNSSSTVPFPDVLKTFVVLQAKRHGIHTRSKHRIMCGRMSCHLMFLLQPMSPAWNTRIFYLWYSVTDLQCTSWFFSVLSVFCIAWPTRAGEAVGARARCHPAVDIQTSTQTRCGTTEAALLVPAALCSVHGAWWCPWSWPWPLDFQLPSGTTDS